MPANEQNSNWIDLQPQSPALVENNRRSKIGILCRIAQMTMYIGCDCVYQPLMSHVAPAKLTDKLLRLCFHQASDVKTQTAEDKYFELTQFVL